MRMTVPRVLRFVPLIMWFPAYTQYVIVRRCKVLSPVCVVREANLSL